MTREIRPEIRIVVLDTTGPAERLGVEIWPRDRALAFHRLTRKRKTPPAAADGAKPGEFLRGLSV